MPDTGSPLPESVRPYVERLLEILAEDNAHKKAIVAETLRLLSADNTIADLKLVARTIHEIGKGLEVFRPYQGIRKITVFGSARTPAEHPRYQQVVACASALSKAGFMVITGGGGGIMRAANEGAGSERSFGININLPLEQHPNPYVDGSPRHFYCQYFFTRKLFFLKESDGVILSPGGFGTLDETFETLTLLQTGRNPPVPVVLLEAPGDDYWGPFISSWIRRLVADHVISPDDRHMLFHTDQIETAVNHIATFYSNYHSFRYAGNWIVLRILKSLSESALMRLNAEFNDVLHKGVIEQVYHWPKNDDAASMHMPRLRMRLDHRRMNVLPQIIRRMNAMSELENHPCQN